MCARSTWARFRGRESAAERKPSQGPKALALDSRDSAVLYNVACLYAVLRRSEEALKCLRKVVRSGWRKEWINHDPDLSSLRGNAEFQRLLA